MDDHQVYRLEAKQVEEGRHHSPHVQISMKHLTINLTHDTRRIVRRCVCGVSESAREPCGCVGKLLGNAIRAMNNELDGARATDTPFYMHRW